jgi:hypothetical protein
MGAGNWRKLVSSPNRFREFFMTGWVLRNDGEQAVVKLENGDRVRFYRADSIDPKTKDQFLRDMPVGPLSPEMSIEDLGPEN